MFLPTVHAYHPTPEYVRPNSVVAIYIPVFSSSSKAGEMIQYRGVHIALEFGALILNAKYGQRTIIKRPPEVSFEELPGDQDLYLVLA